jgi:hypothetical protein
MGSLEAGSWAKKWTLPVSCQGAQRVAVWLAANTCRPLVLPHSHASSGAQEGPT